MKERKGRNKERMNGGRKGKKRRWRRKNKKGKVTGREGIILEARG